jgi:nucleoside diphosphate kinase
MAMKDSVDKSVRVLQNNNKTVVFIPVWHIGKESYYKSVKTQIDSLRKENFVVFYESVDYLPNTDKATKDTLDLKMRRILGYHITSYKDNDNDSQPNYLKNNNYIAQSAENTGLKIGDINADMSINELIQAYEKKYGTILLNDCDYQTDLLDKYNCESIQAHYEYALLHTFRNRNLVNQITNTKAPKIVVLYGKQHWDEISKRLENKGFEISKLKTFKSKKSNS